MNPTVQWIAGIGVVLVAVFVLNLVRTRKLREEYSLLWLLATICLGLLAIDRRIIDVLSKLLGIYDPPNALFTVAFAVGFLLVLHLTVVISRLVERNKTLTQHIALMKQRLDELEANAGKRLGSASADKNG